MVESPWMTHEEALQYCKLAHGSRVLYRAIKATGPMQLQAVRTLGTGALRFKREWLDMWLERMATPVPVERVRDATGARVQER